MSVVIPVLNEAGRIGGVLDALSREPSLREAVVVDGGSTDETEAEVVRHPNARLVRSVRGRARQMNAGAAVCTGEILLFLHADTTLPNGALARVCDALDTGADFGCFELQIESRDLRLRIASEMISARSQLIPSATGDQAQFFRRGLFESIGGFPDLPLFEDMKIIELASARGRYTCIDDRVSTSARRWEAHGVSRTMLKMLALRAMYHLGVSPDRLARYYRTHPREARG